MNDKLTTEEQAMNNKLTPEEQATAENLRKTVAKNFENRPGEPNMRAAMEATWQAIVQPGVEVCVTVAWRPDLPVVELIGAILDEHKIWDHRKSKEIFERTGKTVFELTNGSAIFLRTVYEDMRELSHLGKETAQ